MARTAKGPGKESESLISTLQEETKADVSPQSHSLPEPPPEGFADDDEDLDEKFKQAEAAAEEKFKDDFEEKEPETEQDEREVENESEEPGYTPKPVKPNHKRQAKAWLRTFNVVSRVLLKWGYKTKYLEPGDEQKLVSFKRENRFTGAKDFEEAISNDKEIWGVIERYEVYQKVCEDISLDEDEYAEGLEIISELIADNPKLQMGPGAQLIIWGSAVIAARAEPFIPGLKDVSTTYEKRE